MSSLRISGLNKAYAERPVLIDVDVLFQPGELVTLLGPSGCGKTTLLRIVAGLETADSGTILLGERDIAELPANRRNMGMVFQAYSLFPNMTAAENVAFGLKVRGLERAESKRRVDELMEMVGLGAFHRSYPHQMSGGQQQRVALARALAIQPDLLLLDEPLSALDAKVRTQLREEIRRIQKEIGITTIFVTHDQEEALSISDRVAVMYRGRIDQFAEPVEIYQRPATQFVVEFIGTSSKLEGKVLDGGSGVLEVAGRRLANRRAKGMEQGRPVAIYFRPEALRVAPVTASSNGALRGVVEDMTFLGANTRLRIGVPQAPGLLADVPTAALASLQQGSEVAVTWDDADAHVVPLQ